MRYFARVFNGVVEQVVVADKELDLPPIAAGREWVETKMDGSTRKNYAGIGYAFDKGADAFVAPRPYPSWTLDVATQRWEPPVPKPAGAQEWSEPVVAWKPRV